MSDASKSRNESEEVLKFKREIMLERKLSSDHLERMAKIIPLECRLFFLILKQERIKNLLL